MVYSQEGLDPSSFQVDFKRIWTATAETISGTETPPTTGCTSGFLSEKIAGTHGVCSEHHLAGGRFQGFCRYQRRRQKRPVVHQHHCPGHCAGSTFHIPSPICLKPYQTAWAAVQNLPVHTLFRIYKWLPALFPARAECLHNR